MHKTKWLPRFGFLICLEVINFASAINLPQGEKFWRCGGSTVHDIGSIAPAAAKARSDDPKKFRPLQVYFTVTGPYPREHTDSWRSLIYAFTRVNTKLGRYIKGPELADLRFPRRHNADRTNCQPAFCPDNRPIPAEFVRPCYDKNAKLISETGVTVDYGDRVLREFFDSHGGASLLVFVEMVENTTMGCLDMPGAAAHAIACAFDDSTWRPTHGRIIFCKDPRAMALDELQTLLIHETLHILTAGNLLGVHFPRVRSQAGAGADLHQLELAGRQVTWTEAYRVWKNETDHVSTPKFVLSITDRVKNFVERHFNCKNVTGAELAFVPRRAGAKIDMAHWSMRLFADDILSPSLWPFKRMTNLTLSYLKDSTWYDIDWGHAEEFLFSRPKERGCDVALKSCYDIFKSINDNNVHYLGPYCDKTRRVITPRCSQQVTNGRSTVRLSCANFEDLSNDCAINYIREYVYDDEQDYDSQECHSAKRQPPDIEQAGFRSGAGSTCVTFTQLASRRAIVPYPVCVRMEACSGADKTFTLTTLPGGTPANKCTAVCGPGDVDKRKNLTGKNGPCTFPGELICPEHRLACYWSKSPEIDKTNFASRLGSAVSTRWAIFISFALSKHWC